MPSLARIAASTALAAFAALAGSALADNDTLYAVSIRTYSDPAYTGIEGNIYRVDPVSAATSLVAPIKLDGKVNIGLDGLAIHPSTGIFYGITAPSAAVSPHSLVKIDPATGIATLVGNLGFPGSDISFGKDGTLYVWLAETRQVGRIDLDAGTVTPLGKSGRPGAAKGGLFVVSENHALVAASGAKGTLDLVDLTTGIITKGPELKGARYPAFINSMALSSKGVLFGVNTDGGTPALADLVSIDRQTGQMTVLGPLPNDTDAIDFGPSGGDGPGWGLEEWRMTAFGVLILAVLIVLVTLGRARKTPPPAKP
jgi:DNA-binding beta-propeller fold protein YncE